MIKVDLNVDIGEGFPNDEALLEFATSGNICCGAHAGSMELTEQTAELCRSRDIRIGMHPGYPDREFMGRHSMMPDQFIEYQDSLHSQLWLSWPILKAAYVKPHGAFYNDTAVILQTGWDQVESNVSQGSSYKPESEVLSRLPCGSMLLEMVNLTGALLGLPGTAHTEFARCEGATFISEGFADRAYRPDGTLVPRSQPGAVHHDPQAIKDQVLKLAPLVDSICLHGDTPDCLEFAEMVYKTLVDNDYEVGY